MKFVGVKLPKRYVEALDEIVKEEHDLFDNRSDVIRVAVREYLRKRGYKVE